VSPRKEPSDFLVEQGLLVGTTEYFAKTHVLKREYEGEEHPFGWMQDGVFELFDQEERLYCWQTEEDLVAVTGEPRATVLGYTSIEGVCEYTLKHIDRGSLVGDPLAEIGPEFRG